VHKEHVFGVSNNSSRNVTFTF